MDVNFQVLFDLNWKEFFFIRIRGKIKTNPGNAFVVILAEDSFLTVIQAVS